MRINNNRMNSSGAMSSLSTSKDHLFPGQNNINIFEDRKDTLHYNEKISRNQDEYDEEWLQSGNEKDKFDLDRWESHDRLKEYQSVNVNVTPINPKIDSPVLASSVLMPKATPSKNDQQVAEYRNLKLESILEDQIK